MKGRKKTSVTKTERRPASVGNVLERAFSMIGLSTKIREFKIKKLWPGIVGGAISKKTLPSRLIDTTLYVTVSSSSWMNELRFHKEDIMRKVNAAVEGAAVEDMIFKPGRLDEPSGGTSEEPVKKERPLTAEEKLFIKKTVSGIKDPQLKDLIRRVMEKGRD
ncbi:MAG: DUF721 domain-containing protein [Deltaproteobacteria bacterium]|nr:DUF721 domain-containing protein [Deltaproteobacteria bacterium]